jgi:hypothetical protein
VEGSGKGRCSGTVAPSRDNGLFSDGQLDKAALQLLSAADLIEAKSQMKAKHYKAGTLGHGLVAKKCHPSNPYGPPPLVK